MLCADRVIRDAQSNSISVINIFEEIKPEGLPLFISRFMVFVLLKRKTDEDPSKIRCKLRIAIGSNNLLEHVLNIDFQDKKRNRTIVNIGGLVIPSSGILETSIWLDERMLNTFQVEIREPRRTKVVTHK